MNEFTEPFVPFNPFLTGEDGYDAASPSGPDTSDWIVVFGAATPTVFDAQTADQTPMYVDVAAYDRAGALQDVSGLVVESAATDTQEEASDSASWHSATVQSIPGFTPRYRARIVLGQDTATLLASARETTIHVRARPQNSPAVLASAKYSITPR